MKQQIIIWFVLLCLVTLSGCGAKEPLSSDAVASESESNQSKPPEVSEVSAPESSAQAAYDTRSEREIFLDEVVGKWYYIPSLIDDGYTYIITISKDLTFVYEYETDERSGRYTGKITPEWNPNAPESEMPACLSFDVDQRVGYITDGEFALDFVRHNGSWRMFLEKTYDEESVFDELIDGVGIDLERKEAALPGSDTPKNGQTFLVAFWGMQGREREQIWLEHLEYDYSTRDFESEAHQTMLYIISSEAIFDIQRADPFWHGIYSATTNADGELTLLRNIIGSDLFEGPEEGDLESELFKILLKTNDVVWPLKNGMVGYFTGEQDEIDGRVFYTIALGTDHEEHFVHEIFYGINVESGDVYRYDVLMNEWNVVY